MRKPKTGRTAGLPAEHPPASLVWTRERCAIVARYLYRFIEVSHGSEAVKQDWGEAPRRPRKRAIKALSEDDMATVLRYQVEQEKDPQAGRSTLARRVVKTKEPDAGPDRIRNLTKAVLRVVDRHKASLDGHRVAVAVPDPMEVILNIDRIRKWPF